jgi:hypothetical protein
VWLEQIARSATRSDVAEIAPLCTRSSPIEEAILRPVWPHSLELRRIRLADRTRD